MISIMETLKKYCPHMHTNLVVDKPDDDGNNVEITVDSYHPILLGGDQLTVTRARGTQGQRENGNTAEIRLEDLIPTIEDWHSQLNLLCVRLTE